MDVTKPKTLIKIGAMDVTKPNKLLAIGAGPPFPGIPGMGWPLPESVQPWNNQSCPPAR